VLLTPEQIDDVVDINKNEHTFDFEEVTGKFKIEVRPDFDVIIGEDEYTSDGSEALNDNEFKAISFEFEVVDGYNVYNAKDLSVVDNCNDEGKWTNYKGALKDVTTNGVILHGDITITTADIPSVHIYSDSNKGDYEGGAYNKVKGFMVNEDGYYNQAIIYKRVIPGNGKFTMEGNYYTISADELPLVKNPEWGVDNIAVVCTALFGFIDDYTDQQTTQLVEMLLIKELLKIQLRRLAKLTTLHSWVTQTKVKWLVLQVCVATKLKT